VRANSNETYVAPSPSPPALSRCAGEGAVLPSLSSPTVKPVLRPARPEDKGAIAAFTAATFAWGDYVTERFDAWLTGTDALTLVAEVNGVAVGLAHGSLLSPTEAWLRGLRIHPDHRRHRLGAALLEHLIGWATERGARVVRLSTEAWNERALRLFESLGFRPAGSWLAAERVLASGPPQPQGNGGKRVPAAERLTPAPPADAEVAMLGWAAGPLEVAAHGLFAADWSWRRLTLSDLEAAARRRALWQARSGWAVGEMDEKTFQLSWLCSYPEDARLMLRALIDLALRAGADRLEMEVPDVDWLRGALEQAGFELHPLRVCARAL